MRLCQIAAAAVLVTLPTTSALSIEPGAPDRLVTYQDVVANALTRRLASLRPTRAGGKEQLQAVRAFYRSRSGRPVWVTRNGIGIKGESVIRTLQSADEYGLEADKFALPSSRSSDADSDGIAKRITAEITLTRSALLYANHARGGRVDPRKLSAYLDRAGYLVEPGDLLDAMSTVDDPGRYLRGLHPQHREFEALRKEFLKIRAVKNDPARVNIPNGRKMALGTRHRHVALLRQRLRIATPQIDFDSDLTPIRAAQVFDTDVDDAVRAFQEKNGLKVDGIVGPGTRAMLNGDGVDRTRRLLVNMERWRYMPPKMSDFYVWANIPEGKIRVIKGARVQHEERIVTGKTTHQTPTFSDSMEEIVFNPFWHVPDSIKQNELLPSLLRSPNALARQGLKLEYRGRRIDPASVDWYTTDIRRYHVFQPPSARNALGKVKFRFPNKHAVYFHDTPSKSLFNRSSRFFSHGCVRVRNPRRLAEILLSHDQGLSVSRVRRMFASSTRNVVKLNNQIPVHLTYFTARAVDDGSGGTKISYFRDRYRHDNRIGRALNGEKVGYAGVPKRRSISTLRARRIAKKKKLPFWAQSLFGLN